VILGAVPNPRNKAVVTSDNSLQNRLVTRSGMGFEMSNDGGGAGSTGGGNGASGLNAYGAAPPPAPPGGLLVPNALGGQAQPVIVSDAGDGAALASPDALASSVDTSNTTYARIYVTDSTSGAITHTNRLGAVPSSASLAEPPVLTNPGNLGYAASVGSPLDPGAPPVARNNNPPPFDGQAGIYEYTTGNRYSGIGGHLGMKVNNDLILVAGADGSGDLDISSGGVTKVYAKGPIHLFSGKTVNIEGVEDINIITKGGMKTTVAGEYKQKINGNASATVLKNSVKHTWGASTEFFMGSRNQFNLSVGLNFNLGIFISMTAGVSFSMFLTTRITYVNLADLKIYAGVDVKGTTFAATVAEMDTAIKKAQLDTFAFKATSRVMNVASDVTTATNNGLSAVKDGVVGVATLAAANLDGVRQSVVNYVGFS